MPRDLASVVDPAHTALVLQECQNGILGEQSALPMLRTSNPGLVPNLGRLAAAARVAGVRVIHGLAEHRADGWGGNRNGRLFRAMDKAPVKLLQGSAAVEPLPEIGVGPNDVRVPRLHGLSPFQGTELDSLMRNAGIRTVVVAGVSVNVAITNLVFDAVNAAYDVVLPVDAVGGTPKEYSDQVIEHTLSLLTTVTTTDDVVAAWAGTGA